MSTDNITTADIEDLAHILTLLIKTVNPNVNADESYTVMLEFLTMMESGHEIFPIDAVNYGRAILATSARLRKH